MLFLKLMGNQWNVTIKRWNAWHILCDTQKKNGFIIFIWFQLIPGIFNWIILYLYWWREMRSLSKLAVSDVDSVDRYVYWQLLLELYFQIIYFVRRGIKGVLNKRKQRIEEERLLKKNGEDKRSLKYMYKDYNMFKVCW